MHLIPGLSVLLRHTNDVILFLVLLTQIYSARIKTNVHLNDTFFEFVEI